MANDCFFKKYQFSTDNAALPEFGAIDIMVRAGHNYNLVIYKQVGRHFKIKRVSGDGYINTSGTTSGEFDNAARLYGDTEDTVFRLYDKYNLTHLEANLPAQAWYQNFGGFNLDELEFCTKLKLLRLAGFAPKMIGNVAKLQNCPLEELSITYNTISINLIDLAPITTLKIVNLSGNIVSGTLSQISTLVNLESISLNGTLAGGTVSGAVEALLDAMKSVRENGDTFLIYGNGIITYDGTVIANNASKTFVFDGQGGYSVQS